jgi:hypothetical protein
MQLHFIIIVSLATPSLTGEGVVHYTIQQFVLTKGLARA